MGSLRSLLSISDCLEDFPKGCLPKKSPYGGTLSQLQFTPPPFKNREQKKGHFLGSRPPSPLKN